MKKANNFQIVKMFCQFQPSVAYKSIAYNKASIN